jgi:hypothetical protein
MRFSLISPFPRGGCSRPFGFSACGETRFGGDASVFQLQHLDATGAVDVGDGARWARVVVRRGGCSNLIAQFIDAFLALLSCCIDLSGM